MMMYGGYNVFVVLLLVTDVFSLFISQKYTFLDKTQEQRVKDLEWNFIEPTVVDSTNGAFISHNLHHQLSPPLTPQRSRRDTDSSTDIISYELALSQGEHPVQVVLKPNVQLYSQNLVIEERFYNKTSDGLPVVVPLCHFTGHIKGDLNSRVALSTCNGLTGILMTSDVHYFIEPLKGHIISQGKPHPHVIYKAVTTDASTGSASTQTKEGNSYCSQHNDIPACWVWWMMKELHVVDKVEREDNSNSINGKRRIKRSFSKEYFVETLVVVDHSMVEYYKNEDINTYVFTIMNMVSILFHDASIGNSVNINVVKLLLLDDNQEKVEGLTVTHHADNTLASFCKWQKSLNPREPEAAHHDVAILITRLDICSRMNEPCSTLGLAEVSGMCQPGRSCNVNEDTGLALAYTIAHELGHNFGMKHDGFNDCSMPTGEKSYIMFPEFLVDAGRPLVWSNCSREAITRFLDRGWGFCLQDEPENAYHYPYPDKPPGILYDVSHQCRLQYGSEAEHCDGIENLCITLWCSVNGRCVSRLEPAAEGTICEWENSTETGVTIPKKWCFDGECTAINTRPQAINGGWAEWTDWTQCSRSCGGGVSTSERHCTNPVPSNGGKYCIGERKKYKICKTESCPANQPSFLEVQCTAYNDQPYKSITYEWEPVSTSNPCQLNCKPKNRYFSVMLNDMVRDGTPCLPGTRNLCITGTCRKVGCDWRLDSNATEDRCGICHGDGTSCKTVKDQFKGQPPEGQGYVEATVIPAGARNIRVEEVAEANNYLAVKSEGDEYYLNGHWYIQWTGNYNMAGTTVHYERLGNKEGITAPGPIKEPLHIMLLFQSHNPGVKFEYTVPNQNGTSNETRRTEFHWDFQDWTPCSVSCGGGYQRKRVVCMEKEAGLVDDDYCYNVTKPDDKAKSCNEHLCPARWWMGPWQHCSVSCGAGGVRHRTVLCVRSLGPEEQMALEDYDCDSVQKPAAQEPCKRRPPPCPSLWTTGPWSECVDACDVKTREVVCTSPNSVECRKETQPVSEKPCDRAIVCGKWKAGVWSKCSQSCDEGVRHRTVECIRGDRCKTADRPDDMLTCNSVPCFPVPDNSGSKLSVHNRWMINRGNKNNQASYRPAAKSLWSPTAVNKTSDPSAETDVWSKFWDFMLGSEDENNESSKLPEITTSPIPTYNENWHAAEWTACTTTCGTGQRTRRTWCPNNGQCDPDLKPSEVSDCANKPCFSWVAGSWSECTVSCGGGNQRRNVQCINLETDRAVTGCDVDSKPDAEQECNVDKCNTVSAALRSSHASDKCEDSLAVATCQQLKTRGFCAFKYVSRNCCQMCQGQGQASKR